MSAAIPQPSREFDHGAGCGCLILAQAVGGGRECVSHTYCTHVLQKHWQVHCAHGEGADAPAAPPEAPRWSGAAPLDPVKAILVHEG